jgi:hypothetical protein
MRMTIFEALKIIGIEAPVFMAGSSGAIVFLTKNNKMTKMQRFLTVLSGGLSANYVTPLAAYWLNLDNSVLYGVAFLLGYSGMKGVELLIMELKKRLTSK